MMTRRTLALVLLPSFACTFADKSVGHELAELSDESTTTGTDESTTSGANPTTASGPWSTVSQGGDDDGGEDETTTGLYVECQEPWAPPVVVTVSPTPSGYWEATFDCTIVRRDGDSPDPVSFEFECSDEGIALADNMEVSVDASGIVVPSELDVGAEVKLMVASGRPTDWNLPGQGFSLHIDGELLLAAGSGKWSTQDPDFYAPLRLSSPWNECPGPMFECLESKRGVLGVERGVAPMRIVHDWSIDEAYGFAFHVGERIVGGSPKCDTAPLYSAKDLAIAPIE
ncbi:MAG: hypothetical protein IAG13_24875 [Deltaproteobacteria bacterium]|nr:hypothetical protein [Nannocystaceae bacterium]